VQLGSGPIRTVRILVLVLMGALSPILHTVAGWRFRRGWGRLGHRRVRGVTPPG
jgi:hypothetical protein